MTSKEVLRLAKRFCADLGRSAADVYITKRGKGSDARVHFKVKHDPFVEGPHFGDSRPPRMEIYEPRDNWTSVPLGEYGLTLEALRALILADEVMTS